MLLTWLIAWLGTVQEPCPPRWEACWYCASSSVEVGEPFELVLDLYHGPEASPEELLGGEPALDDSWVLLERVPAQFLAIIHEPRTGLAKFVWRIASLEPGERDLSGAVASVSLGRRIEKIDASRARISVRGVLAEGEDAPRPLREFSGDFAAATKERGSSRAAWLAAGLALLTRAAGAAVHRIRRRRRRAPAPGPSSPLERLAEIERGFAQEGEGWRASCFELTRLLRESADAARPRRRDGLTDEEWLAELRAAPEVPRGALEDLAAILERTAAVKYAGERPTSWSMKEALARSRVALQALGGGAAPEGGRG